MSPTHGLFEGRVEPTIVDNVLDGDGRILQVLKWVHQDEVQHDVIEVQVFHLVRRNNMQSDQCEIRMKSNRMFRCFTFSKGTFKTLSDQCVCEWVSVSPLSWPAPPRCSPSVPGAPGKQSSPQTLLQTSSGSVKQLHKSVKSRQTLSTNQKHLSDRSTQSADQSSVTILSHKLMVEVYSFSALIVSLKQQI